VRNYALTNLKRTWAAFRLEAPLDLRETLFAARWGPRDPCMRIGGGEVWRATHTPHGPATQRLSLDADGALAVEAWGAPVAADWLLEHAAALVGLHDDPAGFQPEHALLRRLAREHRGLRLGRTSAVFEACIGTVLEQRVATVDGWASWRAMVYALGEPAPGPLPGLRLPPSSDRIAHTPYESFHRLGVERRRAEIVKRLAIVAPRLEETLLLPLEDAYRRLAAVPGVGPWTRARVGLVALGDPDAVMTGDLHLPHAVSWALAGERRGSEERMLELLEPYRGHRGRVVRLLMAGSIFKR
jgi:3-methyladenine DNA glycosylase/8-oxoguanine DNA glycosylase